MPLLVTNNFSTTNEEYKINIFEKNISIQTLNIYLDVLNIEKIKSVNKYFNLLLAQLNCDSSICDYLSKKQKNDYNIYIKGKLKNSLNLITSYFFQDYVNRLNFFKRIKSINYKGMPQEVPEYKHNTKTGRAYIKSGFNFMTLKKEERKNLTHDDKYRKVFEIDFVSCEPSFYLNYLGIQFKKDVYEHIAEKISFYIKNRDKFKRAIIAIIYGADSKTIKRISNISVADYDKIKSYLKIDEFKERLEEEYKNHGMIKNFYKRPILSNHNLVNYWIQSSVADYCCLAFNQFLNNNEFIELHAFIHDSIIFSCPNENINDLKNVISLSENKSNFSIKTKITPLY